MANTTHWQPVVPITVSGVAFESVTAWLHVFRVRWTELADSEADPEHVADIGVGLYRANCTRDPAEVAQQAFAASMTMAVEDEDDDPVGPAHDPGATFAALAVKHGLIRTGDKLDQNVRDAFAELMHLCASVGDRYGDPDDNAGDHIRAIYTP